LITFVQSRDEWKYRAELEQIFDEVILVSQYQWKSVWECVKAIPSQLPFQLAYFRNKKFRKLLESTIERVQPDAIHTQHLRMSQYTQDISLPVILDLPDAYSLYWKRRKKLKRPFLNRIFDRLESKRVTRYEKVVRQYAMNLVCSVEDLHYMRETHPSARMELLRNGVDLDTFKASDHDYSHNHTLLFTGNMDYAPNVDGVVHFVNHVLPRIRKAFPQVGFRIVGQRPVKAVLDLAGDNVEVTGFVEDLAAVYNEASVVVAPLRFGAGTQNKVIESMAMGVPVVCTNIGFKGLEIESGEGAIMAAEDEDFVEAVIALLQSEEKRKEVGQKGLQKAVTSYGWEAQSLILEGYFKEITA
jgi:glycosyltransferase involved in cell wall biosynthesis